MGRAARTRGADPVHMRALMATILEFRQLGARAASLSSHGAERAAAPAEIVLFPGIRYERWEEAPPPPLKPSRRSRKRDKHEDRE
jgi:hypothetical protein